jgi:hypothetical protein
MTTYIPTDLFNIIINYKNEMEEIEKEEYEEALFNISMFNYENLNLKQMKKMLKRDNHFFKIKGYYKMNKKTLKKALLTRQSELLKENNMKHY